MGLETATWIDDLVPTNPVPGDSVGQGDNHLNLIKQVLQNQFTNLGSNAVTVSASQINNMVQTFNGRSGPAITPAAGDYALGQMSNVSFAGLADNDVLIYDSGTGQWRNETQASLSAQAPSCGWYQLFLGGAVSFGTSNVVWFNSPTVNDNTGALATVSNSSPAGWRVTAATPIKVDIHWSLQYQLSSMDPEIRRNGSLRIADHVQNPAFTDIFASTISASTVLDTAEYVNLYVPSGATGGNNNNWISMTVQEVTIA